MFIVLYNIADEPNKFPKNLPTDPATGNMKNCEGTLRDESDVLNPVIWIEGADPSTVSSNRWNYAYIPFFSRYYFIREMRCIRTNVTQFSLHVDVLNTYANQIKTVKGYCERSENIVDENIYDNNAVVYNRKKVWIKNGSVFNKNLFSGSIANDDYSIILLTSGETKA